MQLLQQDSASLFYSDGIFIGNYKIPLDIQNQIVYWLLWISEFRGYEY